MRVHRGIGIAVGCAVSGAALVACFDLLHTTSDLETACELDASRPGCAGPDASRPDAGDTDFCAWSPDEAQVHALQACAWLGACETPLGDNAFGPCYFRALMTFDCAANPNHRARGEVHRLWDCLQRVRSCGDVDACVFGPHVPTCSGAGVYTACATTPLAASLRLRCDGDGGPQSARASGENCALWGQTCAKGNGANACAGESTGIACDAGDRGCDRAGALHWCEAADGGVPRDLGIDCTGNGAGVCQGFPSPSTPYWTACEAETDAGDIAACTPDASATCDNGRAVSCPSGVVESLDCARLLGSPDACNAGAMDPPFDWTSPCALAVPVCTSDSCDGGRLTSCERGASFSVDCASAGLGGCQLVPAEPGGEMRAACTPSPAR